MLSISARLRDYAAICAKLFQTVLGVIIAIIILIFSFIAFIKISNETALQERRPYVSYTRMMMVASLCSDYERQYGHWPIALSQLIDFHPELETWAKDTWGYGDNVWGRYFIFVPYNEVLETVLKFNNTLVLLGFDGVCIEKVRKDGIKC